MVEANNIFVLMLILYLVCSTAISIDFETSEFKYIDPEFRKSLDSSPASEQSQMPILTKITDNDVSRSTKTIINEQMSTNYYQLNQFPIIVSKNFLYHTINNNYGDDTICIFVQAINNFDKTLNDINIYEIAPQDIKIINCSVPIMASSLDESIRYTRGGSRLLSSEDISDPIGLANKLKVNEHTSGLKANFSFNDCDSCNTKCKDFLKNFNDFIAKSELSNQTEYIDRIYLSKQTKSLLDLNKEKDLLKIDQQLINFLLMRDLYPSHIRKPEGYIEP